MSELSKHHDPDRGWWIAVHGRVHDVTELLSRHPGGHHILYAYAGLDASQAFQRVHSGRHAAERLRRTVEIGLLWHPRLSDKPLPASQHTPRMLYRAWVQALYQSVEMRNALRLDRSFVSGSTLDEAAGQPATTYQLERAADTFVRYQSSYLPRLTAEVLVPLIRLISKAGTHGRPLSVNTEASHGAVVEPRRILGSKDDATALRGALTHLDSQLEEIETPLRLGVACFETPTDPRSTFADLTIASTLLHEALPTHRTTPPWTHGSGLASGRRDAGPTSTTFANEYECREEPAPTNISFSGQAN